MPIFISYSHENKNFVDALAHQLVLRNVNVWLDRWELSIGDSIVERIQSAIDGASALLVVLSQASVASEWCKKEINSGFLRELEEKRVFVMPVLLEDCEIPIFARGKLYADFRRSFDEGLRVVLEGVAKVSNPSLGRIKGPEYHTDWSVDWGDVKGNFAMILTYVEQAVGQPYTCLTTIEILASQVATRKFQENSTRDGPEHARRQLLKTVCENINSRDDIRPRLSDEREKVIKVLIAGPEDEELYQLRIGARRLGEDTGRDILINTSNLLRQTLQHMEETLAAPKGNAL